MWPTFILYIHVFNVDNIGDQNNSHSFATAHETNLNNSKIDCGIKA